MFVPIGGFFIYSKGGKKEDFFRNFIIAVINLFIGGLALFFAYRIVVNTAGQISLKIFGYVIIALALIMILINLIGVIKNGGRKNDKIVIEKNPE